MARNEAERGCTVVEHRGSGGERRPETGTDRREVWRGVREAHAAVRGEHQIAEYVAALEIGECARILASDPEGLPRLAALRDECRVGRDEKRTFEEVIRTWTVAVLSGAEGG
jgi:hypothetical protein